MDWFAIWWYTRFFFYKNQYIFWKPFLFLFFWRNKAQIVIDLFLSSRRKILIMLGKIMFQFTYHYNCRSCSNTCSSNLSIVHFCNLHFAHSLRNCYLCHPFHISPLTIEMKFESKQKYLFYPSRQRLWYDIQSILDWKFWNNMLSYYLREEKFW